MGAALTCAAQGAAGGKASTTAQTNRSLGAYIQVRPVEVDQDSQALLCLQLPQLVLRRLLALCISHCCTATSDLNIKCDTKDACARVLRSKLLQKSAWLCVMQGLCS